MSANNFILIKERYKKDSKNTWWSVAELDADTGETIHEIALYTELGNAVIGANKYKEANAVEYGLEIEPLEKKEHEHRYYSSSRNRSEVCLICGFLDQNNLKHKEK